LPQDDISVSANTWRLGQVEATSITAIRIQNIGHDVLLLQATVGEVVPTSDAGAIRIYPKDAITADQTLASLFPGVPGANRVYVKGDRHPTRASFSHA
jgi:hypothetical protein